MGKTFHRLETWKKLNQNTISEIKKLFEELSSKLIIENLKIAQWKLPKLKYKTKNKEKNK